SDRIHLIDMTNPRNRQAAPRRPARIPAPPRWAPEEPCFSGARSGRDPVVAALDRTRRTDRPRPVQRHHASQARAEAAETNRSRRADAPFRRLAPRDAAREA